MTTNTASGRVRRKQLALLTLLFGGYYLIVAFFPGLLALPVRPGSAVPVSIVLALALIWTGFLLTVWIARSP
ncbi:DUF485 domain-containing protein [Paludibacterium paludis]|uniref:DUF485 domain-containing protein n=1 Tax=Paludibacterium paludis TaxID=1225769 RepID=A0A918P6V8_9NEIS|nr:DUF485 domain-containing protein [Paludibacterium paludis]GGY27694.1 hypothetical protein GCM10011289_33800 [Paludibacterium paludis]